MALGADRQVWQTNVRFASSGAMERGGIASFVPWVNGIVYYAAGSGESAPSTAPTTATTVPTSTVSPSSTRIS